MMSRYLPRHWVFAVLVYAQETSGPVLRGTTSPEWRAFLASVKPWIKPKRYKLFRAEMGGADMDAVKRFIQHLEVAESNREYLPTAGPKDVVERLGL